MNGNPSPNQTHPHKRIRFNLSGRSTKLDPRVHAARGDLADLALAGTLFSAHYARAVELTCVAAGMPILASANVGSQAVSELLRGETFHALDVTVDWAWGFCGHDGYVGYIRREALDLIEEPTHCVTASAAPIFVTPDIKSAIADYWPHGAEFRGEVSGNFIETSDGFIHARHAETLDVKAADWTSIAERYLGMPYVWGGRGYRGVDCSGLVQIALQRCGINVPRDTDLQAQAIGKAIAENDTLRRGDFIFFPGHVGIMADDQNILHANAHWMSVVIEPIADVINRVKADHPVPVTARRRIEQ